MSTGTPRFPTGPLHLLLDDAAARYADRPAIDFLDRVMSYGELGALADKAAEGFQKLGVGKGRKVGLLLPNCPASVISYFGVLKAGGTVVNFNPLYAIEEIKKQVEDSETDILVTLDLSLLYDKARVAPGRNAPESSGGLLHGGDAAPAQGAALPHRQAQGDRQRSARFPPCVFSRADRQCRQPRADGDRPGERHRGASIHRRDDRHVEGRDAEPRQSHRERGPGDDGDAGRRGRWRDHGGRAAAVPRLRHDGGNEFQHPPRRQDDPAAPLRARPVF